MSFSERVVLCRGQDFVDPNHFFGVAESIFGHVLRCEGIGEEQTGNIVRRLMEELRRVLGAPGVAAGDAIPPCSHKEAMTDAGRRVGRTMQGRGGRNLCEAPDIERAMSKALHEGERGGVGLEDDLDLLPPDPKETAEFAERMGRVFAGMFSDEDGQ